MKKIHIIILIIFLPLYFLLKSVEINTFNKDFYLKSYEKYDISNITGKDLFELDNITSVLLEYINNKSDESILKPFFNKNEIRHMKDVRDIFKYGIILKNISFVLSLLGIIMIFIYGEGQGGAKIVFYGNLIWWGLILLLFLLSMKNFNKYFTYFHLLFFDNDLWLLNPETDLLIQMFPEKFFISIFKKIVLLFIYMLAIIQIVSYILMKIGRDDNGRINNL